MLQTLGLVLKDRRGQLLQAAAQQVGRLLGPFVTGKLPASRYERERKVNEKNRRRRKEKTEDEEEQGERIESKSGA